MSIVLPAVLSAEDLERVRSELAQVKFISGKRTAGAAARDVKDNLQADGSDPRVRALDTFVADALRRHPLFEVAARPAFVSPLMFSRYEEGMTYGSHTDDAMMGPAGARLRTDLAFTLFLEDPSTYQGGALVIESALGEQEIKLKAGDAFLYQAGTIHRVAPVTKGARLAAVGWVESYIADPVARDILLDLSAVRNRLSKSGVPREELLRMDKAISNLLRMWAR